MPVGNGYHGVYHPVCSTCRVVYECIGFKTGHQSNRTDSSRKLCKTSVVTELSLVREQQVQNLRMLTVLPRTSLSVTWCMDVFHKRIFLLSSVMIISCLNVVDIRVRMRS